MTPPMTSTTPIARERQRMRCVAEQPVVIEHKRIDHLPRNQQAEEERCAQTRRDRNGRDNVDRTEDAPNPAPTKAHALRKALVGMLVLGSGARKRPTIPMRSSRSNFLPTTSRRRLRPKAPHPTAHHRITSCYAKFLESSKRSTRGWARGNPSPNVLDNC